MLLVSYKGDAAELLQQRIPFTFHVNIVTWRDVCREKCVKRGGSQELVGQRVTSSDRQRKRQTEKETEEARTRQRQTGTHLEVTLAAAPC